MKPHILTMLIGTCIVASSCNETKPQSENSGSGSFSTLPANYERLSYTVASKGRHFEQDKIPSKEVFLNLIHKDVDARSKEHTSVPVELNFMVSGLHLHKMIKVDKEGEKFSLSRYDGPFEDPQIIGSFNNMEQAIIELKKAVEEEYEINQVSKKSHEIK